jgi:hypothetical protein
MLTRVGICVTPPPNGNAFHGYTRGPYFDSRPENRLTWLSVFMVFLSPRQVPSHGHFLPWSFLLMSLTILAT